MSIIAPFSKTPEPSFDNEEDDCLAGNAADTYEETANKVRRAELRAQRDARMADLKVLLEDCINDMRETANRLLTEIGTHVNVTHSVQDDYQTVLETQQKEATRLEEVSKTVNNATNPFLETIMSEMQS